MAVKKTFIVIVVCIFVVLLSVCAVRVNIKHGYINEYNENVAEVAGGKTFTFGV